MSRSPQWYPLAFLTVVMALIDIALALILGAAVAR